MINIDHHPHMAAIAAVMLLAVALLLPTSGNAAENAFELWFSQPNTVDVGKKQVRAQFWFDTQLRRGRQHTDLILRPAIGIVIRPWVNLHVGYAWTPRFQTDPWEVRHEHRIWEQVTFNIASSFRFGTLLRTRLEQRFRQGEDDVGWRIWQLLRFGYKFSDGKPFGLVLQDQVFFNLNDKEWGRDAGFDQNRLFFGPTFDITGYGRIEVGYMFAVFNNDPDMLFKHIVLTQLIFGF
jgi:hypothetical protein